MVQSLTREPTWPKDGGSHASWSWPSQPPEPHVPLYPNLIAGQLRQQPTHTLVIATAGVILQDTTSTAET